MDRWNYLIFTHFRKKMEFSQKLDVRRFTNSRTIYWTECNWWGENNWNPLANKKKNSFFLKNPLKNLFDFFLAISETFLRELKERFGKFIFYRHSERNDATLESFFFFTRHLYLRTATWSFWKLVYSCMYNYWEVFYNFSWNSIPYLWGKNRK